MSNETEQKDQIPADRVGEGNQAADRRYRDATARFIASGKVAPAAAEAARALDDDDERRDLEQAEEVGRAPAKRAKAPRTKSASPKAAPTKRA